jgi:hypothetical protein
LKPQPLALVGGWRDKHLGLAKQARQVDRFGVEVAAACRPAVEALWPRVVTPEIGHDFRALATPSAVHLATREVKFVEGQHVADKGQHFFVLVSRDVLSTSGVPGWPVPTAERFSAVRAPYASLKTSLMVSLIDIVPSVEAVTEQGTSAAVTASRRRVSRICSAASPSCAC